MLATLKAAGPQLQDALLGPAAQQLDDQPVVIVPPGKFHSIPWGAASRAGRPGVQCRSLRGRLDAGAGRPATGARRPHPARDRAVPDGTRRRLVQANAQRGT
jgi:hypothetical protein